MTTTLGSLRRQLGEHLARVVGDAVVDEDDLVVGAELGEHGDRRSCMIGHRRARRGSRR